MLDAALAAEPKPEFEPAAVTGRADEPAVTEGANETDGPPGLAPALELLVAPALGPVPPAANEPAADETTAAVLPPEAEAADPGRAAAELAPAREADPEVEPEVEPEAEPDAAPELEIGKAPGAAAVAPVPLYIWLRRDRAASAAFVSAARCAAAALRHSYTTALCRRDATPAVAASSPGDHQSEGKA